MRVDKNVDKKSGVLSFRSLSGRIRQINKIMKLTIQDIKKDIVQFQQRIQKAQVELTELLTIYLLYLKHKKREKIWRDLQTECSHYIILIEYAGKQVNFLLNYSKKIR